LNTTSAQGGLKIARKRSGGQSRRSAIDTRRAILEAAEQRLTDGGPESIRLQEIATDVGISHPAILHHFGSREGLVEAMVLHGLGKLQAQFLEGWPSHKELDLEGVLERFYEVASHRGVARMLAWLILSGRSLGSMTPNVLRPAAERMHAGRVRRAQKEGRRPPVLEETLFAASFLAILVLGDSLFGPSVRRGIGLGSNAANARRFRRWLTKVLERMETRATHQVRTSTASAAGPKETRRSARTFP
jgi:AcrR family transcriptional regulator